MSIRTITADRGDAGVRVDRVLLRHLSEGRRVSRTRIQALIDAGAVHVNGRTAPRAAWRIAEGDELRVDLPDGPPRRRMQPEAGSLDILFEDDWLLAVNKPPGIVVHPSYKHPSGTLMNAIVAHAPGATLLNRLDKDTSGLVLIAKERAAHTSLQAAMGRNEVGKEYLAAVVGKPSPVRGTIDLALDRDPWDRRRVTVRDRGGVPSVTKYERLAVSGPVALVSCQLITGRMHQIRVHLAARGWPIIGDRTYGPARHPRFIDEAAGASARAFPRQALHAWRMRLMHPVTGAELAIEAPLPPDLVELLDRIGLSR